jgi:diguanylate cyclase (GGDEF)-like protein/PAS domain S-box-containing protein
MAEPNNPVVSNRPLTPAVIALLYAVFGTLWIVVSGSLLKLTVDDPLWQEIVELAKGLLFVFISAGLLFLVLRQWQSILPPLPSGPNKARHFTEKIRWRVLSFMALAAIVPLAGYVVIKVQGPHIEQGAYANLEAIAELKTSQVENWLDERYNDGMVIMATPGLVTRVDALQRGGGRLVAKEVRDALMPVISALQYESALLVDPSGKTLLEIGSYGELSSQARALLPKALASTLPLHSEIYLSSDGTARIDFVVPLQQFAKGTHTAGAVILHITPDQFLFPYIGHWPTASESGESLLIRRDGDNVLYMNERRQGKELRLISHSPMSQTERPAVVAVMKRKSGRAQGNDYRGVPVLAAYRPVSGTDWTVLTKLDRDEVLEPLHALAFWVSLIALLAIATIFAVMLSFWRQRGQALRLETQTQSDRILRQFYDLPFIGIAISDPVSTQWLKCNDRLCEILGYTREELLGKTWAEMTHSEDLDDNLEKLAQVRRGKAEGYVLDKRFVRKDGTDVYVSVDLKCARRPDGSLEYLFSTVQDVTERKLADAKIRRLTQIYAALSECNQAIVHCKNAGELFPQICRFAVLHGGMKLARISLLEADSTVLRTVASFGEEAAHLGEVPVSADAASPLGRGGSGTAVRECRPVWVQDFINDPMTEPWHERGVLEGWRSSAALPLTRDGVAIGVLRLYSGEVNAFDETIRNLLVEMAVDISFALSNFANEMARLQMETELRDSESRFRDLYENAPLAYQSLDGEGNILEVNNSWLALFGRQREEVIGRFVGDFLTNISITTLQDEFLKLQQQGRIDGPQFYFVHHDGSQRLVMVNGQISRDREGNFLRMHCILTDLTERMHSEEQLRLAAKVFEQSAEGVMITDPEHHILLVNRAFSSITGFSAAEALGQNPRMLASGYHDPQFFKDLWDIVHKVGYWQGEMWNRRKSGEIYPELVSISQVLDADEKVSHYVGIFSDISEHKASQAHIHKLAHFDALTGLPNRSLLADRVGQALSRMERNNESLALVFLDLDRFKNVNDSLGHRIGDQLLIQVAERLKSTVRDEDTVSRLGGDEFILVLPGASAAGASHVVEKVLQKLSSPYRIEQHELTITPSLGIAMYPSDGDSYETLSMCADAAMYRAKQGGRNTFRFFTREMQERSERTLLLENALRRVLESRQLQLYFQPQISLHDNQVIGAEALLRWYHPELGMVSPGEFIPVAEDSGLILPIGEWVLREAVCQMKAWISSGMPSMVMAVNLSAIQFRQANLSELVSSVLDEFELPPECLELELTEGAAMENPLAAIEVMNVLHERGIRMSIDDFGTGYSSLSYLKRFKVYKLKIDQSFVRDISTDPEDEAIVEAIIGLSRSLGLQTIAEGVETAEQLAFLRSKGCDEVQGYFFGKPMPAKEFEEFVRSYPAR